MGEFCQSIPAFNCARQVFASNNCVDDRPAKKLALQFKQGWSRKESGVD